MLEFQEEEQFYESYSEGKVTLEEFADQSEVKKFNPKKTNDLLRSVKGWEV